MREHEGVFVNPSDPAVAREAQEWTDRQAAHWGYVPNYAAAFDSRPDVARAWTALNVTVRDGMDRRRFEIATIAAARALQNTYCTVAHSKFLRDVCGDEASVIALATDVQSETLDATDQAIVAFAGKMARSASAVSEEDVAALRDVGLTDNEIADIVFAVAARSFFTRVLDGMGVLVDHELAEAFDPALVDKMVVGRGVGAA